MNIRHSQALEELFGLRQSLESMRRQPRDRSVVSDSDHASPADAGHRPELISELCR